MPQYLGVYLGVNMPQYLGGKHAAVSRYNQGGNMPQYMGVYKEVCEFVDLL